jgi:hypothetical protein
MQETELFAKLDPNVQITIIITLGVIVCVVFMAIGGLFENR